MRKIVLMMHVSADGFVAGENNALDWITYNEEIEKYAHAQHDRMDAVIWGRNTFEMMKGYWPTVFANPDTHTEAEVGHARWLESTTKVVLSKTLTSTDWANTVFISGNLAEELTKLKQQDGKDIWMIGSAQSAQELMRLNLIDEYLLNINPVLLGCGVRLVNELDTPLKLELVESKLIKGGVMAQKYVPARA